MRRSLSQRTVLTVAFLLLALIGLVLGGTLMVPASQLTRPTARAQVVTTTLDVPLADVADTSARLYRLDAGDLFRPEWEFVKKCAGKRPKRGGNYEDVKWLVISPRGLGRFLGLWIPPDTIVLDSLYVESSWLVSHELMHHLLRGPDLATDASGHPQRYFAECRLLPQQNIPLAEWNSLRLLLPGRFHLPGPGPTEQPR